MSKGIAKSRWHLVLASMAVGLLLSCGRKSPPAEEAWPSWAPDSQRVVYECYRRGPVDRTDPIERLNLPSATPDEWFLPEAADLCISDIRGGEETRLITDRGGDWRPSWSPDGTLIAYLRQDGIYITTPEGRKPRRILDSYPPFGLGSGELAWSPASDRLLFTTCHESGNFDIYVLDVDSSVLVNLTSSPHRQDYSPKWVLGGAQVVYLSSKEVSSFGCSIDPSADPEFRIVNVDGTGDRPIDASMNRYPRWHVSATNGEYVWYAVQSLFRLNVVDGAVVRELAPSREGISGPLVAPNEERLIYQEELDQVRMLIRDTNEVSVLIQASPTQGADLLPWTWSPDSEKFTVLSLDPVEYRTHTVRHIYIYDLQEGTLRPLVTQH